MRLMWLLVGVLIGPNALAETQTEPSGIRQSVFQVVVDSMDLQRQGNHDEALAMLRGTLDEALTPPELALVNESLGNTFYAAQDYEGAKKYYHLIVDDPINLDTVELNRTWYRLAATTYSLNDYEGVVRVVAQWRERMHEPLSDAYKLLAFSHLQLGNRAATVEAGERYVALLRKAGKSIPTSFTKLLEHARRPEGEASDFLTTELSGLASPAMLQLLVRANGMIENRRYEDATIQLADAIKAEDPTATEIALLREKLAWALAYQKDMEGAREQYRAITQAPADLPGKMLDKSWMRLASVNYKMGAYEETLESIETWKNRVGEPNIFYYRLVAMSQWQLGRRELAVGYGKRYIELVHEEGREIHASFKELLGDALSEELKRN